jgi:S1-C subfamily serine protease
MRMLSLCVLLVLPAASFAQTGAGRPADQGDGRVHVVFQTNQIGVEVVDVRPADVTRHKLPGEQGAVVTAVTAGTPAEKAGIKTGDVILGFDGQPVRSVAGFNRLVRETPAGRAVTVAVMRDGRRLNLTVALLDATTVPGGQRLRLGPFREGPQTPPTWAFPGPPTGQPPELTPDLPSRLQELLQGDRSQIGIGVADVQAGDVAKYKLPGPQGAIVTDVTPGRAADRAGIKTDDVIVEFDGERVRSASHLQRLIGDTPAGRPVKVAVMRDGKRLELSVTPADPRSPLPANPSHNLWAPTLPPRPYGQNQPPRSFNPRIQPGPPLSGNLTAQLGIGVQDLTPQLAEYFGTSEGVLVGSVTDNSPASLAGVKAGDVITAMDGTPVRERRDVHMALLGKRAGGQVKLGIVRDRRPLTLTVTMGG